MTIAAYASTGVLIFTVILGLIGLISPGWVMELLHLSTAGDSKQGLAELRAVNGALFVGLGLAALFLASPAAALVVGFGYLAAASGRIVSILVDDSGTGLMWRFTAFELLFAAILIWANWRGSISDGG